MKSHYVKDLLMGETGFHFQCVFRVVRPALKRTASGKPYLTLMLADRTGEIETKWWQGDSEHLQKAQENSYARICGKVEVYNDKRQVIVQAPPEWLDDPLDISEFELVAALPLSALRDRLAAHIASVQSPPLNALLRHIFDDEKFRAKFDDAPGAQSRHHACRHGLLQHTLEVTDVVASIAEAQASWGYAPVSRDLAVTGALLHDVGKVKELTWTPEGNYGASRFGEFVGHIMIGVQWVNNKVNEVKGFPVEFREALLHIVTSHHGKKEFGSPIPPMFAEAQIVHTADLLNVELFYMQEAMQRASADFAFVKKLDNRKVYTRPWESLDTARTASAIVKEAPVTYAPHVLLPQPRRTGPILALRFHIGSGEAPDNTAFHTRRLPLVGRAAAGVPRFAEEHIEGYFDVADEGLGAGEFYLLAVEGTSMTGDDIQDGDMVVARRQTAHQPDEIAVLYFDDRQEATLKRVRQTNNGSVELLSSNPDNPPLIVADPSSLRICGRVVGVLRN